MRNLKKKATKREIKKKIKQKEYKYPESVKNLWVSQSQGHKQSTAHCTRTEASQIELQIKGPMVMSH